MGKLTALAVAVIVLLLAGLGLVVYRLAEFSLPVAASADRGAAPASGPRPDARPFVPTQEASPWQAGNDPAAPIIVPAGPVTSGPVMNEAPPIQGPAPVALPADPVERQQALQEIRKQRVGDQMERLNRRNAERMGQSVPANEPRQPPKP